MSKPEKPDTLEETVYQLWYAILGSNGDGMASQLRETRQKVQEIQEYLPKCMTHEEHNKMEEAKNVGIERRKMTRREKLMLVFTGVGSLAAACAVIVSAVIR